ncbi:MAG: TIGR03546 family protein [Gammaproteobacteria bacterium]|nr:TIGR03546 family protein [Gammaproteobacteria bacterium]MBU2069002.1 TIGR03546 family protein [Gammaproteobacteria bacterium]MBU2183225.1 TIGR03546 family protein [Gammaproteobacteria bacterium]MBU2204605.1 TIGR03546 family protein [Gammaproteobacteria bacterium]
MLTLLAKILKVLNSQASPWQIGWAIALGLFIGILPFGLLTLLLLLLVCLLTINLSVFLLVWGLTEGLMLLLADPLERLTWQYAQNDSLLTLLANTETLQLLHLHHTLTLGAFALGALLLLPVAWLAKVLVQQYRSRVMTTLEQWKVMQMLKASKLYALYEKLN